MREEVDSEFEYIGHLVLDDDIQKNNIKYYENKYLPVAQIVHDAIRPWVLLQEKYGCVGHVKNILEFFWV